MKAKNVYTQMEEKLNISGRDTIDMQNLVKSNNEVDHKKTMMKEIRRVEAEIEEKEESIQNIENMSNIFNIQVIREKLLKRVEDKATLMKKQQQPQVDIQEEVASLI